MNTRVFIAAGAIIAAAVTGCLDDRQGNLAEGEECRETVECGAGLECVAQTCVPTPPIRRSPSDRRDAEFAPPLTPADTGLGQPDLPPPEDVPIIEDVDPNPEPNPQPDVDEPDGRICTPGERECVNNTEVRVCSLDGERFQLERCANGTICQNGVCTPRDECFDADGDGFPAGPGCQGTVDCNDDNPRVNPRQVEVCDGQDNDCDGTVDEVLQQVCRTDCGAGFEVCVNGRFGPCSAPQPQPEVCDGQDNDCDGFADEGNVCMQCCEPDSCGPDAVCVDCSCVEAPPNECLFQNQPCNPFETLFNEQYECVDFAGGADGICFGRCDFGAPDEDETCPDPDSICAFEFEFGEGLCLRQCDPATQTGCFEDQGCIALGDSGGCTPTGDGDLGEACNDQEGVFDQCSAGLICTQFNEVGTTCERLCNPFGTVDDLAPVCDDDQACFSFSPDFGFCFENLERGEGEECPRRQAGQMCADDVICHPERRAATCRRLCRFENGDDDCIEGGRCRNSNELQLEDIGVCR